MSLASMSDGTGNPKASEQFRERLVSRYFVAVKDLAQPEPGVDVTDTDTQRAVNYVPRSSADSALNAFAQLLLLRLNVSHALISLIDSNHQYVLAEAARSSDAQSSAVFKDDNKLWVGSVVLPRESGVCSVVLPNSAESASYQPQDQVPDPDVVVINDLKEDPRFCNRRYVVGGPQMRWYAGAPVRSPDGTKLGAVCVFDVQLRQNFSEEERSFLSGTAKTVANHLEAGRIQAEYQRRDQLIEGLDSFVSGLSELTNQRKGSAEGAHPSGGSTAPNGNDNRSVETRTMWEAALPSGCKQMFSRAANVVQAAGGYDGVAFFYVPSTSGSSKAGARREHINDASRPGTRQPTMSGSSAASAAEEDTSDHVDSRIDQDTFGGDENSSDALCPILGFSVSQTEEQVRGSYRLQFPRFLMRDMQRLMGSRPRGRVYLLNNQGAAFPGDTSSSGSGAEREVGTDGSPDATGTAFPIPAKQHKRRRAAQLRALMKLEPRARAFICLPLWDYNRQRWFAFSVYWILKPTRDPSADRDLKFLQVFGNSITNALAHLDSVAESRAKDSFVSSVSHELRSPLHGILGATNFLYDSNMGRFQREMVDTITSCGRTLLDSLEHVMDFAKINNFSKYNDNILSKATGPRKQQMESRRKKILAASSLTSSVDMSLVIEEVVEAVVLGFTVQHDFLHSEDAITEIGVQIPNWNTKPQKLSNSSRTRSARGRVRLCLDLPTSNSVFETQPGAWRRIIMNLVGNALKYTEEGSIIISLAVEDEDPSPKDEFFEQSNNPKNEAWLVLTVRDTGIGMSNDFLQNNVFKAFSQEDSLGVGVGLGLSIVDQVVDSMGGHVEVASAKGSGTTFSVHVPLSKGVRKPPQSPDEDLISSVTNRLNGLRVCILEDASSKGSQNNTDSTLRAEDKFTQTLIRTLNECFASDATVSSQWTPEPTDLIICLEPSFRQLQSVRSLSARAMTPPVLLIAYDALEVAVLRADSRVTSPESFVEITYQPLGPRKLAAAMLHCLDQARLYSPRSSVGSLVNDRSRTRSPGSARDLNSVVNSNKESHTPSVSAFVKEISQALGEKPKRDEHSTVLCVDDNPLNLRLITTFVAKRKLPFERAVNGQEAVDAYRAAPRSFRCVLMDISMPVMDGMTATRLIRQYEAENSLPRVSIYALTGLASAAARNEALEAGIDRLFTKPVPFSALTEILSLSEALTTDLGGANTKT